MAKDNQFSRGSEWRKWDLHLHSPDTKINNQYGSGIAVWDEFCKKIEDSDVKAFGITDYFSGDAYSCFIKNFNKKYPDSHKIFFPNIELRTNDVVNAAQEEVNVHLIFNSFLPDIEKNINLFLQSLYTNKTVENNRHVKASELSGEPAYIEATTTREFIMKALRNVFGEKADLTEYVLIFTAANNDGIRTETEEIAGKIRGKKRKVLITDELDKFSDGFFGSANNTQYFLQQNRLDNENEFIKSKPVISGCDAHSFSQLSNWLGVQFLEDGKLTRDITWIKADLTFEGLRQIVYEPAGRVFIGQEPEVENRVREKQTKYINSIQLGRSATYDSCHGSWFHDVKIKLSKELVAVIGNKGSGKSALTDIMGLLGNSHNQLHGREELFSFLNKEKFLKNNCASHFQGQLSWYGGQPDVCTLNQRTDENLAEKVEYLPQKYLEKICSNIEDDEFRKKLNEVIFGYIDANDRLGKTNLDDLITYLSSQAEADITLAKETLHSENEKVVSIERKLTSDYKKSLEKSVTSKTEEIEAHRGVEPVKVDEPAKGQPSLSSTNEPVAALNERITKLKSSINKLECEQQIAVNQSSDLVLAKQAIERCEKGIAKLQADYQKLFTDVELIFGDVVNVSIDYEIIDKKIQEKNDRLAEIGRLLVSEEEISVLEIDESEKEKALCYSLAGQFYALEKQRASIINLLDKPQRDYQDYLNKKRQWDSRLNELVGDGADPAPNTLNWLSNELKKIDSVYPKDLERAIGDRDKLAREILSKKQKLVVFYNKVKKSIDTEIDSFSEELGGYDISIDADLRLDPAFYICFFDYINQAVRGSFYGVDDGRSLLESLFNKNDDWQNHENIFTSLKRLAGHLHEDKRDDVSLSADRQRDIFKQMKQQKDPVELYDYLYGFDYLKTKYNLKVDGKNLSELSPGERGGLLLVFYLMLDKRDMPLIIDQPEDNLDNKSIYEILVTFLKKAKKRRQI